MKLSSWLIILCYVDLHKVVESQRTRRDSSAAKAIVHILNDYLAENSKTVDLIDFESTLGCSGRLFDSILRHANGSVPLQVSKDGDNNQLDLKLNVSTILTFESIKSFKERISSINWQSNPKERHKHLVSVHNMTTDDLENFTPEDGFKIDCVNFLVNENERSIDLAQNVMFSEHACQESRWHVFNRFDKLKMKWTHSDFYPNKYRNLHGCPLVVAVNAIGHYPYVRNVIWCLSTIRNFTILRKEYKPNDSRNHVPFQFDFVELFINSILVNAASVPSVPLIFSPAYFVIPPGEPYSQLEKMFMMFDFEVWIAIFVTFMIALVSIQIVNLTTQSAKSLVYGSNITSPTLNLMATFLVGGQNQMPRSSFARFLLLLFMVFSLIIRTCHQSTLFKFLQADLRKPKISSYQELVDRNFTYLSVKPILEHLGPDYEE